MPINFISYYIYARVIWLGVETQYRFNIGIIWGYALLMGVGVATGGLGKMRILFTK